MHEMSIAHSIIAIAEKQLEKENASIVLEIVVDIGKLSGVEYEALEFALEAIKKGSVLQNALIELNRTEAKAECTECEYIFLIEHFFDNCPKCGSYLINVIKGKDLKVRSMVVE